MSSHEPAVLDAPPRGPDLPPQAVMAQMAAGSAVAQALYTVARLGIADRLADGPRDVAALAREVGADPDALLRLLRALAGVGVFAEVGPGSFVSTPLGECLRTDAPGSLHPVVLMSGDRWHWSAWGALLDGVKTGRPPLRVAVGADLYEYLDTNPEAAAAFHDAMTVFAGGDNAAVLAAYPFPEVGTVVDVGGGFGTLLPELLQASPALRGVLFDRPEVVRAARPLLDRAGVADRCEFFGGDFFDRVPPGGDVYILKCVLHNWDDDRAVRILANCRAVLGPGARLLVAEAALPDAGPSGFEALLDLEMFVTTPGGRERKVEEYESLLSAAGLALVRVLPTRAALWVLECTPR